VPDFDRLPLMLDRLVRAHATTPRIAGSTGHAHKMGGTLAEGELMSWVWRLEGADGAPSHAVPSPPHPSQSDAESWLGETWRELATAGVAQVSLLEDGRLVYGPMLLTEG
jgi:hypothetical protein